MLFLNVNRSFWDAQSVQGAMSMVANQYVEHAIETDKDYIQVEEAA